MKYTIDTAIIGGGPAGVSCAISLQRNGISNLVVEKRRFPRDKTCGGLVTLKTYKLLSELLPGDCLAEDSPRTVFCDSSNLVEIYDSDELLTSSYVEKPLHFVKRMVLDSSLTAAYRESGGMLIENAVCQSIDTANRRIVLSSGDEIEFQRLVIADGALSSTRKMLGYKNPKLGFCLETHVSKSNLPTRNAVRAYFGVVEKGYGWVFPSGNELCIGLGGVYHKKIRYNDLLKQFLVLLHVNPEECACKGAFVPYGTVVNQNRGPNCAILVGDAGGFVDPISGEGLYFALASGMEAANAVASGKENVKAEFIRRFAPSVRMIREGNWLQGVFFQPPVQKAFKKRLLHQNRFVSYFFDHQVSEYQHSYMNLRKLYLAYKGAKESAD